MPRQFLIIYGWGGSGPEHWQSWLANKLTEAGGAVCYPSLPNATEPKKDEWIAALHEEIQKLPKDSKLIVLTHSLGGPAWLQYLAAHPDTKASRVYLIAPPPDNRGIKEITDFFPYSRSRPDVDTTPYMLVGSDTDNYISIPEFHTLAKELHATFHFIPEAGHVNTASGYGPWPWILEECLKA